MDRLEEIKEKIELGGWLTWSNIAWLIAEVERLRARCEEAEEIICSAPDDAYYGAEGWHAQVRKWLKG